VSRGDVEIHLQVNGQPRRVTAPVTARLLDVLRDDLGLTGAKEGCSMGECGACAVLVDGTAVNACLVPAFQAEGTAVTTVEGIGRPGALSPVQEAFVRHGAVQCGYCTPGFVVTGTAMLQEGSCGDRQALAERLSGNICRCTGYRQLLAAMDEVLTGDAAVVEAPPLRVGECARRVDAEDKVAGLCEFTADLPLPEGCLHGVTVRAERVHARLEAIDVSEALAVPGVVRVLTAADVPGELHYGNAIADQPVLVSDHVRFWGEAVAVVLAETLAAARAGAALVELTLTDLPPVTGPEAALAEGAPQLHPDGNLPVHQRLRKGDAAAAIEGAAHVLERTYRTPAQEHLYLEPEAALVVPREDGGLIVRAPSQNVFFDRHHLCKTLGLDRKEVRVIQQHTGAAFGGREDIYAQIHAALGVVLTGRPVRIVWTREETQVASTKRHPATMTYRAGVDERGRIQGLEISALFDTGAYSSWAPNIARKALVHAAGTYAVDDISVDVRMAYTNNGISGAFRGFGAPQVAFAVESFVDELAERVGMDPVAFRRANHLGIGKTTATGQEITGSCGLQACVEQAVARAEQLAAQRPPPPPHVDRGRGISTVFYGIGYGNGIRDIGSAVLELLEDGSFRIRCGAIEYGQGLLTVFTQIAVEELGVRGHQVSIWTGDSQETPDSGSSVASRQTYVSGEAVRQAAVRLRETLLGFVAEQWGLDVGSLRLGEPGVLDGEGEVLCSYPELYRACTEAGIRLRRQARNRAHSTKLDLGDGQGDAYWPYAFAAHVVDVEVDRRDGRVRVISLVAAHDVGRAINPLLVEGQVTGGATQGLGFALHEDHRLDEGVPVTLNMNTYRVPGAGDVPEITPILVEDPEPTGPFGAKGVGEPVLVAVPPAVANAVAAATGCRFRRLPIRPEDVLAAQERSP